MRQFFLIILNLFIVCAPLCAQDSLKKAEILYQHSLSFLKEAEKEARTVLRKNPSDKNARVLLAKIYFKQEKLEEAFKIFSDHEDYLDDEALLYYGVILEKKNLFEEALKIYGKIESSPYKEEAERNTEAIKKKTVSEKLPAFIAETLKSGFSQKGMECGAEFVLIDEKVTITPDHREISYRHFVVRIINERGKHLAEVKIPYDSTYEKVTSVWARTITPSGKIIEVGKENIRDVSRYMEYPLYSNSRVKIISMPQVQEGCIVEYKATVESIKLVDKDKFSVIYLLQTNFPIKKQAFTLKIPSSSTVHNYYRNREYTPGDITLEPQVQECGEEKVYSWTFFDVPPLKSEPRSLPVSEINPSFIVTNFSSWDQIYKWWKDLYQEKLKPTALLTQTAKSLVSGVKSEEEKLRRIFNFCAKEIRYVAVEYGKAGHEPHRAEDILINKYGDCKDQSMLLVSLLNIAGIEAVPVLISTKDAFSVEENEPAINFNHAIVYARLSTGQEYFLDPTAETANIGTLPFSDQERMCLVFKDSGPLLVQTPAVKHSALAISMRIREEKGKFYLTRTLSGQGLFNMHQRYFVNYSHPDTIEQVLLKRAKKILPDARLTAYEIRNQDDVDLPLEIEYAFEGEKFFTKMANIYVPRPFTEVDLNEELISKEERSYPLYLDFYHTQKTKIELEIPRDFGIYFLPVALERDSPWIYYKREYVKKESSLIFEEIFLIKKEKVQVAEYPEFKKFYEEFISVLRDVPLFTQPKD